MESDMDRAVAAARDAFDNGPWRKLNRAEHAKRMRALTNELREPDEDIAPSLGRTSPASFSRPRD